MVVEEMERLNVAGINVQVDGKNQSQILEELSDLEKQVPGWDYRNICWNMLNKERNRLEFVPPTLYIVLPSDPDSWIDSDPSTHQFRLFFLCDIKNEKGAVEDLLQHMHVANHPGYIIKQPQEFFQVYGDYSLRLLRMVKYGYYDELYEIPQLETFKILWNCDSDVVGHHLTMDTFGPLVDKAIAHLEEMSLPTRNKELTLTRKESVAIETFLEVHEDGDTEGNLYQHIKSGDVIRWICHTHVYQRFDQSAMKDLKKFVFDRGGHIDLRHSTLEVELGSQVEADQFLTLLTSTKHTFDISLKLDWKASRSYARVLCLGIAKTGTAILEIDGISLDIIPQGRVQYATNLFSDAFIAGDGLQLITLHNYPRPQEQCFHFYDFSLQSTLPSTHLVYSWEDLAEDVRKFRDLVYEVQVESDLNTAVRELQSALEKHGLFDVIAGAFYSRYWDVAFDLEKVAFVEVYSVDTALPLSMLTSGCILRLTIDYRDDGSSQQDFINIFQPNIRLKELNISYRGHDVHYYIDHAVKMWRQSPSSLCLTLLDRMEDTRGRTIAQLASSRDDYELPGYKRPDVQEAESDPALGQEHHVSDDLLDIQFMYWDCDHIFSQLSDYSASFLDTATQQHPSVLTMLTLDISQVSRVGLASAQNILGRSSLEHLHILCTHSHLAVAESITQVLCSVPWLALKSLILSGDNINEWIRHWPLPIEAPQLMSLQIRGAESSEQELSHASTLFVHQLVYANPLMELHLEHIQFEDKRDWHLITESMDPALLEAFDLVGQ
ncbi:hypothetical protein BGZ93_006583 [Podila epicladia]|nr:hypothetical protein BGZ93_006583 [Podila epicladia]